MTPKKRYQQLFAMSEHLNAGDRTAQATTSLPPNRAVRYDPFDVSQCLSTEEGGTREGTAGVWSAAVDAVLHGRRIHIPR